MCKAAAFLVFGVALTLAQNRGAINLQHMPPSMAYQRVWVVTPLVAARKTGDPVRTDVRSGSARVGERATRARVVECRCDCPRYSPTLWSRL